MILRNDDGDDDDDDDDHVPCRTEEHVFGHAAADPAAPVSGIGKIVRVHEDPAEVCVLDCGGL